MKKILLGIALVVFLISCAKAISKEEAQKISADIISLAKEKNKGCTSGFMNKEITEQALQKNNTSARSWAKFLKSDEGKTFFRDILKNCMTQKKEEKKEEAAKEVKK